jgi:multidrug resistance efflux pump
MPALTVAKVAVGEGAPVNPGDLLVEFDSGGLRHRQTQAEKELIAALWEAEQARKLQEDHPKKVELQKLAIRKAESDLKFAIEIRNTMRDVQEKVLAAKDLDGKKLTEEEKAQKRRENFELQRAEALAETLKFALEKEQYDLKRLEAVPANADVERSNAKVEVIRAKIEEAKEAVEGYKLRAQVAGTVEQVRAAAGMTFGPTAREPLMYLVPSGKRVVRGEVEAEFAHKIDAFKGKTVTIYDAHRPTHTYTGKVSTRLATAYLPKRFGGDSLVAAPARVLECLIEIADPTPSGKPPLLPGQQVRVVFGQ